MPTSSKVGHSIRWHRSSPRDDFSTPRELAKNLIKLVPLRPDQIVYDPFRGGGAFYDQYPDFVDPVWSEVKEGLDFFQSDMRVDWIVSNPPYSCLDDVLAKSFSISKLGVAYLLNFHALTPRRIERAEHLGFGITGLYLSKVFDWYGISSFVIFEKGSPSILSYDRTVWRKDEDSI